MALYGYSKSLGRALAQIEEFEADSPERSHRRTDSPLGLALSRISGACIGRTARLARWAVRRTLASSATVEVNFYARTRSREE